MPGTSNILTSQTIQLNATVTPSNATNPTLVWASSNTAVATVSSTGLVTGITAGNATITATTTDGTSISATCSVTVNNPVVLVNSVSLPLTTEMTASESLQLIATVLPANATNQTLSWSSSDPTVATVNSSGIVTGIVPGTAVITAITTDGSSLSDNCTVTVLAPPCTSTGNISYQIWENIGPGYQVVNLTSNVNYPNNPTNTILINSMEGTTNYGDNFGARIAGYICAPATGSYTFWIAGNDNCELWLSTDDNISNTQKIAYHLGGTLPREWNKYATQKSVTINLIEGHSYYIEALLKDGTGSDNLSVGWIKPGQSGTEPSEVIPGSVLSQLGSKSSIATSPLKQLTYDVDLMIYPNPLTSSSLNIKIDNLENEAELVISTLSGMVLHQQKINSSTVVKIDRNIFRSGIYVIKLFNDDIFKNAKLIVP
jgi:hypothetical protein